ncbi:DUF523 domain-containing protein [Bacillus benzoevorans]|uniref:Uncharacterized protein YbbK (DUF523 family) n=1 Tax=Bacillus benzoevorans TaxID=1456 RepID=A0A7X0HVH3_9BACI|nr:DUF523 domain-containing protein [Bacillus benzoevorans]MBB6446375.1 uncharacterized protein YbbK (DUF523 family) [Bacillus benzoevorans]
MIVVSACLAGLEVKYNGSHNLNNKINEWFTEKKAIPVCPEVLGGLSIPREPAEIAGGTGEDVLDGKAKVMTNSGKDVTEQFIAGAEETLKIVKETGAKIIILKERSPSCGSSMIYKGNFNGEKTAGNGVTAALLKRNGIIVVSEENYENIIEKMEI